MEGYSFNSQAGKAKSLKKLQFSLTFNQRLGSLGKCMSFQCLMLLHF